jgi:hypothetical protein
MVRIAPGFRPNSRRQWRPKRRRFSVSRGVDKLLWKVEAHNQGKD